MHWIKRHTDLRADPKKLLPECRTVISLAYPYSPRIPMTPDNFGMARYTEPWLPDYHHRLRNLARCLAVRIVEMVPQARTRVCVDSAPIMERSFAYAAGLGFIGKNNALILPGYGSYVFLAEILTTVQIPPLSHAPMENQCGACEKCIQACPTGALEAPFSINAGKCLSYLTIEHAGKIDPAIGNKMGRCFLGCDICQQVCPYNKPEHTPDILLPPADAILDMKEKEFVKLWGKTALNRAGLAKIKRNIRLIKETL